MDREAVDMLHDLVDFIRQLRMETLFHLVNTSCDDTTPHIQHVSAIAVTTTVLEKLDSLLGPLTVNETAALNDHVERYRAPYRPLAYAVRTRLQPDISRIKNS